MNDCSRPQTECFRPKVSDGASLRDLVKQYNQNYGSRRRELLFFASQPSLATAVETAALAIDSRGKRHPHHRQRSQHTLSAAREALLGSLEDLQRCRNFSQLLETVEGLVRDIPGLGELYLYDTTLRIGSKLGLMPEKVYLHAGAREGARALGLACREKAIEVGRFPAELRRLAPYEIENFLCVFKGKLK